MVPNPQASVGDSDARIRETPPGSRVPPPRCCRHELSDTRSLGADETGRWLRAMYRTDTGSTLPVRLRLLRMGCIAVPTSAAMVYAFFVSGVGGLPGGWLWASAITTSAATAVGWFGFGAHRGRTAITAVLAVGGLAFGIWISQESVLSSERLPVEMDSISVPSSFDRVGDVHGGSCTCLDECSYYERRWVAVGSPEDVQATLTDILTKEGFILESWGPKRAQRNVIEVHGHRGRLGVAARIDPSRTEGDGEYISLPPGQVGVSLTIETYLGS